MRDEMLIDPNKPLEPWWPGNVAEIEAAGCFEVIVDKQGVEPFDALKGIVKTAKTWAYDHTYTIEKGRARFVFIDEGEAALFKMFFA